MCRGWVVRKWCVCGSPTPPLILGAPPMPPLIAGAPPMPPLIAGAPPVNCGKLPRVPPLNRGAELFDFSESREGGPLGLVPS